MKVSGRTARLGLAGGAAAAAAAGRVAMAYRRDIRAAQRRVSSELSHVIPTRFGGLEYAVGGGGRPVLMVHGAGGGFDQGLFLAAPLIDSGFKAIAPSRFGYLRSDLPPDPSAENQADAFAALLDRLRIDRLPVIGWSAGVPSATAFAVRHPDRCAALVAVEPPGQPQTDVQARKRMRDLLGPALRSDFLFWSAMKTRPEMLTRPLLAADPDAAATADRARDMLARVLPVTLRRRGLLNDARRAANATAIEPGAIHAPTLVVALAHNPDGEPDAARRLASEIPDSRLIELSGDGEAGGGREAEMFRAIGDFLRGAA